MYMGEEGGEEGKDFRPLVRGHIIKCFDAVLRDGNCR